MSQLKDNLDNQCMELSDGVIMVYDERRRRENVKVMNETEFRHMQINDRVRAGKGRMLSNPSLTPMAWSSVPQSTVHGANPCMQRFELKPQLTPNAGTIHNLDVY